MKILVLAPHAYYVDRGTPIDLDILLRALSNQRDEQGKPHDIHAAVYHEGQDRDYPNVTLHRIDAPPSLSNIGPGFSGKKLKADRLLFKLAKRLVRQVQPDIIHAGEEAVFFARYFKLRRGIPYVYDMDSSIAQQMVEKKPKLKPVAPLFNLAERQAVRHALACAPVCHALADVATKHGAKHLETLHDISQLADPRRPRKGWLADKLGIPADRPVLMYVGNFEKYQGVDLLLEGFAHALKQHDADVELAIAGGTDANIATYTEKAKQLGVGDRAHFLGRWPADQLDELLAEADILTAPRIKGVNTPQKIFPYLHSGRAVLLTDLPTHTQIVNDTVCALAQPNAADFGRAIAALSADPDQRESLGRAGQAFVEANHTFPAHQRRVDALYAYVAEQLHLPKPAGPRAEPVGLAA
ncbi:MAG: glycosyltransferase family 4 protein [Planctomycetota bacterium]